MAFEIVGAKTRTGLLDNLLDGLPATTFRRGAESNAGDVIGLIRYWFSAFNERKSKTRKVKLESHVSYMM